MMSKIFLSVGLLGLVSTPFLVLAVPPPPNEPPNDSAKGGKFEEVPTRPHVQGEAYMPPPPETEISEHEVKKIQRVGATARMVEINEAIAKWERLLQAQMDQKIAALSLVDSLEEAPKLLDEARAEVKKLEKEKQALLKKPDADSKEAKRALGRLEDQILETRSRLSNFQEMTRQLREAESNLNRARAAADGLEEQISHAKSLKESILRHLRLGTAAEPPPWLKKGRRGSAQIGTLGKLVCIPIVTEAGRFVYKYYCAEAPDVKGPAE